MIKRLHNGSIGLIVMVVFMTSTGYTEETRDAPGGEKEVLVNSEHRTSKIVTLFLSGDVMTGRGVDQILATPSNPVIYESYMRSADGYVRLAERVSGPIHTPVDDVYIWGDAISILARIQPDVRIINLETSITTSPDYQPKGINYRMHPDNIGSLRAARIDGCVLANNNVLDWGRPGLIETLNVLDSAGIASVGAGISIREAEAPAIFNVNGKGRIILFAYGHPSSGTPKSWAASADAPGVNLLPDFSEKTVGLISRQVADVKQPGDVVLLSVHWGGNWGYRIPPSQRRFAHRLIDAAGVDCVYGHSSHHFKGIEVYNGKLILYGCGDFLNDYEGISGREEYRSHLILMYFPGFAPKSGHLMQLTLVPMQIKRFQSIHASPSDRQWIMNTLNREGTHLGTRVESTTSNDLKVIWN